MDLKVISSNTRNCVVLAQDKHYWRTVVNAELNLGIL
jgi:hypothetical protein